MYKIYQISGKVQGVWFRASTKEKALSLGLTGWVRNLPDGSVEAVATGDEQALIDFERWLNQGPPEARVTGIESKEVEAELGKEGFVIL